MLIIDKPVLQGMQLCKNKKLCGLTILIDEYNSCLVLS